MKKLWWLFFAVALSARAFAAVPVILAPVPKLQFFDASGRTLPFGCVFSYKSGTTTPLATYTDATGTVPNANPVILDSGGFPSSGGIWLQAGQAYTLKVKLSGGTNCASGSTLYTVDGIGGGLTLQTTVVASGTTPAFPILAQNQLFEITLTANAVAQPLTAVGIVPPAFVVFQITQDAAGGHTFGWPANLIGGAPIGLGSNQVTTQEFVWNGINATAIGPGITGDGPELSAGDIFANGLSVTVGVTSPLYVSTTANLASTGQVRFGKTDNICWRNNLNNANLCLSLAADSLAFPNGLSLGGGSILATTNQSGTGNLCLATNCQLVTPALNGVTISGTPSAGQTLIATSSTAAAWGNGSTGVFTPQAVSLGSPVSLTANTQATVLSKSVTFPAAAGNYRADMRSGLWITTGPNACATEIIDTTNNHAYASGNAQNANGSGLIGIAGAEISSATYAAGATVTFHLAALCNANSTAEVNWSLVTGTMSPEEASFLQITPIPSN